MIGVDGAGVRRRIRAGDLIPPGLRLEGPQPTRAAPPEMELLGRRRRAREMRPAIIAEPAYLVTEPVAEVETVKLKRSRRPPK